MRSTEFSIEWSNSTTAVKVALKPPTHRVQVQHTDAGGGIKTTKARPGLRCQGRVYFPNTEKEEEGKKRVFTC